MATVPDPSALVTGVGGQDGVYLARALRAAGQDVIGTVQPGSDSAAEVYLDGVSVVPHDVRDGAGFRELLEQHRPAEVYNLAAFTSVGASWGKSELVGETNGMAVLRMLESLVEFREKHGWAPKFLQASTSEMFGQVVSQPQDESTPHHPRSPYAAAKSFAHHLTVNYRESYGLFAVSAILYNHESPLRPAHFVTRKITQAAASIALGLTESVSLGNLDVCRDWGAAPDYARAMQLMLSASSPRDYVVATGVSRPLSDILKLAFDAAGLGDPWPYVIQDPALMRPADVPDLRGDFSRAQDELGWAPSVSLESVIARMVEVDLIRLQTGVEDDPSYL